MMTSSIEFYETTGSSLIKEISAAKLESSTSYNWLELRSELLNVLMTVPPESLQTEGSKIVIEKCIDQLNYLIDTPFTIQRICELVLMLDNFKTSNNRSTSKCQYSNFEKYLNALYKCLNVCGRCDDPKLFYIEKIKIGDKIDTIDTINHMMDTS